MNFWQRSSTPKYSSKYIIPLSLVSLVAAFFTALLVGATRIDVIGAISEIASGDMGVDGSILLHVRLPRAVAACLAGGALAVSGTIVQAVLNNAMASPSIIGVNSGAALGVCLVTAFLPGAIALVPLSAFLGGSAACLLIYLIAAKTDASRMTVTLTGIAVSSLLTAIMSSIKAILPDVAFDLSSFSVGGFSAVRPLTLTLSGCGIALCLSFAVIFAKKIDLLSLGEDTAHSLGMNVRRTRLLLLLLAGALAGLAVSFAGLIGFVGLVIPHLTKRFTGLRHALTVPVAALWGSTFVIVCDTISRVIFSPYELPTGILLSLIGAPFFIAVIFSSGRKKYYD